ncbi:MAG: polysaccharide biosynthesis/export family protein [Planctomycetales bacterium]|nr:polysaccharide biosynthesis/export family protein [Planctomycetales bacterium]
MNFWLAALFACNALLAPICAQEEMVGGYVQSGPAMAGTMTAPQVTTVNRYEFSACNPPAQMQVPSGRCLPCTVAVDCADNCGGTQSWRDLHRYNFQPLAQGEYLGPVRLPAAVDYRVRVGDQLRFTFMVSRVHLAPSYALQPGDKLQISLSSDESFTRVGDLNLGTGVEILPTGMLHLPLVGPVQAAGLTIQQLREALNDAYAESGHKDPRSDVIPIQTNTLLRDLLDSVDARNGAGGQNFTATVNPDGTLRLPKVTVSVQGMTLDEIKREVNLRYAEFVGGLEVEPILLQQAQHFVYVTGKVANPNRFELLGPTSVTQALAMAGGVLSTGNNRQIVIFRRAEDWRILATRVDLRGLHSGRTPPPADEIWLRDNDVVIVPVTPIGRFNEFVDQVFTRGVYGVFPFAQVGDGFNASGFSN